MRLHKLLITIILFVMVAGMFSGCQETGPTSTSAPESAASATSLPTEAPEIEPEIFESFEESSTSWAAGLPPNFGDSSAVEVSLSDKYASDGKQSLAMTFGQAGPRAMFVIEGAFDFSEAGYLQFDLDDPDGAVQGVGFSLSTSSAWLWHEAKPAAVKQGENTLTFDLAASTYWTDNTDGEYNATIADLASIQRVAIILYPKADGTAYLDQVRLLPIEVQLTASSPIDIAFQAAPTATKEPEPLPEFDPADAGVALTVPEGAEFSQFKMVELDVETNVPAANHFDPEDLDIQVTFNGPAGKTLQSGAFWYQEWADWKDEQPSGEGSWKVRFTPTVEGDWSAVASIAAFKVKSESVTFSVAASDSHGFVRINQKNPRYLAFDDGAPFLVNGINMGWWEDDPIGDYERWLDDFSANGGNTIRVWMASWSYAIEWQETGLGDYTNRMKQAWLLDQLFKMAEERDIYILLVLSNHGQFSENTNPEWAENPYNAALGGPLASPGEFVTDETARMVFKRRLNYIAHRWGYSTNILAWEWWNEINWTPINDEMLVPWIQEMDAYLAERDPYAHLTTESGHGTQSSIWQLPEMDIPTRHLYATTDMYRSSIGAYQDLTEAIQGKPLLFAEFGYSSSEETNAPYLSNGEHLHNGLWAPVFNGFAGTGMYWWWDTYVDPQNQWYHFKGISEFFRDEDLSTYTPMGILDISGPDGEPAAAKGMGLSRSDSILIWLRNDVYTGEDSQAAYEDAIIAKAADNYSYDPPDAEGQTITLSGVANGAYTVQWFDPQTAEWLDEETVTAKNGTLVIVVPTLDKDLAAKISR
ncbi:MAG: DUF5060 domain-containing protein [Anaerolineae bacterium]|nr:DUF5060 domain-containing protein [Anaerolineae bacterium]